MLFSLSTELQLKIEPALLYFLTKQLNWTVSYDIFNKKWEVEYQNNTSISKKEILIRLPLLYNTVCTVIERATAFNLISESELKTISDFILECFKFNSDLMTNSNIENNFTSFLKERIEQKNQVFVKLRNGFLLNDLQYGEFDSDSEPHFRSINESENRFMIWAPSGKSIHSSDFDIISIEKIEFN